MKAKKRQYFKNWRNWVELVTFTLIWCCFGFLIVRLGVVSHTKKKYLEDTTMFTNFENSFLSDEVYGHILAFVVFILFIKFVKLFRFNKKVLLMISTLKYCMSDLLHYFFTIIILLLSFAQLGFLLFGNHLGDFKTILRSLVTLLNLILGEFDFQAFQDVHPFYGRLYFAVFVIFTVFIMINVLIAIINKAFQTVSGAREENKYEIVAFLYSRFAKLLPAMMTRKANVERGSKHDSNTYLIETDSADDEDSESLPEIIIESKGNVTCSMPMIQSDSEKKEVLPLPSVYMFKPPSRNFPPSPRSIFSRGAISDMSIDRVFESLERIKKAVEWEIDCDLFEERFLETLSQPSKPKRKEIIPKKKKTLETIHSRSFDREEKTKVTKDEAAPKTVADSETKKKSESKDLDSNNSEATSDGQEITKSKSKAIQRRKSREAFFRRQDTLYRFSSFGQSPTTTTSVSVDHLASQLKLAKQSDDQEQKTSRYKPF